jgi:hypothetical protein
VNDDDAPSTDEPAQTSRILDLDGDGVPDAVETISVDVSSDGRTETVEIVDEIDAEIDDEGVPHHIEVERVVVSEEQELP